MQKGGGRLDILSFFTFSSQLEKFIFFLYQPCRKLNSTEKAKVSAILPLLLLEMATMTIVQGISFQFFPHIFNTSTA